MFPRDSKTLREDIKIHHTMRIMPEDQNTGGFYVALIRKNAHVNLKKSENKTGETIEEKAVSEDENKDAQKIKLNDGSNLTATPAPDTIVPPTITIQKERKRKQNGYAVPKMDYTPFAEKFNDAWVAIRDMYGFEDVIPHLTRISKTTCT